MSTIILSLQRCSGCFAFSRPSVVNTPWFRPGTGGGLPAVLTSETSHSWLTRWYRQRTIPILEPRLLARLKAEPKIITLESGGEKRQVEAEFIFHSPEGKAYYPRNWYDREHRSFMKDLIKAHPEIPSLTPHELRHTRATLWLAQGVPQHLIADLLGHCDTRMLERVYNHTTTDTLRQALEAVQTKEGERA